LAQAVQPLKVIAKPGPMVVRQPNILGHESAGVIVACGSGVSHVAVGDRVAIEPGIPCRKPTCAQCSTGRYNGCTEIEFASTPPFNGTLRRYFTHPAAYVFRLPPTMSFEEGALLEPLSVALAGLERANVRLGDPLLICGAGPIGIITLIVARAAGACPIVITDIDRSRLDFAESILPTVRTVQIVSSDSESSATEVVSALGMQPAIAIDCTGVESSIATAISSVAFGGTVFVIGVGRSEQKIPFMTLSTREIDLKFQYRYSNTWPKAIRLVSDGVINLKQLVTHRYSLEDAMSAFEVASDPNSRSIKVQIGSF